MHVTNQQPAPSRADQREAQVLAAVVSLVDSLLHNFDVVELLTQLSERSAQLLDVASAGLLLTDPFDQLHLMAATSRQTRDLELLQLQAEEGPCLDCYASGQLVSVADLSGQARRWPRFVAAATEVGVVSVHAIPMRAAGRVLGALGLFGTSIGELNAADLAVGQTLAHIATVAIVQEHAPDPATVTPSLRNALANRTVVEQAKGFLRATLAIPPDDAFALLRLYATQQHRHLTELARSLISDREARPALLQELASLLDNPARVPPLRP
jgi:transcriptional regulator with GAF, ATPase, and Fis domain